MSVVDYLKNGNHPISFEIIPPKRGGKIDNILGVVGELMRYDPPFIDVTSHAAKIEKPIDSAYEVLKYVLENEKEKFEDKYKMKSHKDLKKTLEELAKSLQKKGAYYLLNTKDEKQIGIDTAARNVLTDWQEYIINERKRPGTLGVCTVIQERFGVDSVPHSLCKGFTQEETEDFLLELNYVGIRNILALQGDDLNYDKKVPKGRSANKYGIDLVKQIKNMNNGKFLHNLTDAQPTNFCIGVAGYPDKHFYASDIDTDITHLKNKVDAGADYIVTQMFFDNNSYFNFVKKCRDAGITVPIIPGLKVITKKDSLKFLSGKEFNAKIPNRLSYMVRHVSNERVIDIGAMWTANQVEELLANGVPSVHFYVMQSARPIHLMMKYLKKH